jgi:hypothetical protein
VNEKKVTMMDTLLARYFDGELTDGEARELLDAADANPKLENELRAYERMLATARALPTPRAPAGFTERVMESIAGERFESSRRSPAARPLAIRPALFRVRWAAPALAAAVVIVAFVGGVWLGRGEIRPSLTTPETRVAANGVDGGAPGLRPAGMTTESGLRYVRLVYVPRDASIDNVAVAGTFNDWDPNSTPLQRQDGIFSTILVLPAGSYEYMFVEDGDRWVTDPLAARTRDDGFGTTNAVLDVEL